MKSTLEIYKELKLQRDDVWRIAIKMSMYASIESFIDNPTDDEYEIISSACYNAYMKADDVDLVKLTDRVAEAYNKGIVNLDYIKEMRPYALLDKFLI